MKKWAFADDKEGIEAEFLNLVLISFIKVLPPPVVPSGLDWKRLERIAANNLLMPILLHMLDLSVLPSALVHRWESFRIGVELHYQRSKEATRKICAIMNCKKVEYAILRGMALAEWVYPSPSLRPMVDVDILVPATMRPHFPEIMANYGLSVVRRYRSQLVYVIDGIVFEIHFSFLTPKRYRQAADWTKWLQSRQAWPDEPDLFRLSPENELLELVLHAYIHHKLDNGLQLVDIALLCQHESMDWDYISWWCKEANASRIFWFVMAIIDSLFEMNLSQYNKTPALKLPGTGQTTIGAYVTPLFGHDSPTNFINRSLHQLHVAETPLIKLKQCLRFISYDYAQSLLKVCAKTIHHRNTKKGVLR